MSIPLHIVYGCFQATMAELIICDRNHSANKVCNIYYPFFFFFLAAPCGMQILVPQGLNPGPLQWKHWSLTIGSPGKSLHTCFLTEESVNLCFVAEY